jgi:hypothetical protein
MEPSQPWADQAIQALEIEHLNQAEHVRRRRDWTKQHGLCRAARGRQAEQTASPSATSEEGIERSWSAHRSQHLAPTQRPNDSGPRLSCRGARPALLLLRLPNGWGRQ